MENENEINKEFEEIDWISDFTAEELEAADVWVISEDGEIGSVE